MNERQVYIPTEYIEGENKRPVLFLAGPIQGTHDWQSQAIEIIYQQNPDIIIASPRRDYFDATFDYDAQVDWESAHLRRAANYGAIMFWLAKETDHNPERAYAQTTRAELFEWKVRHEVEGTKLVIGIEDGFSGARYIRKRFGEDCPDVRILDSLDATCQIAIDLAKGI